jgi:fructoselysine-6-P-deglycase FrlB-like protein/sugar/nucleoside kinase (ribokinase family)
VSLTPGPDAPDVIVVGNLTIDDVVRATGETTMASPGGNSIHAATAARIWDVSVGVVARVGDDYPAPALAELRAAGLDTGGMRPIDGPTVRNWVIYEADGRRHWVYRTPPGRRLEVAPGPNDIPAAWAASARGGGVVHVAAMPLDAATRIVARLRSGSPGTAGASRARITLDTHEAWDAGREAVLSLARQVDVFLPSHGELAAILGYDDPERGAAELLSEGVRAVVVKCGSHGALAAVATAPAVRIAPPDVTVVDATGAGDAFCGGLAAGLALGDDLTAAAQRGAATAGAALGASGSLRLLRPAAAGSAQRLLASYRRGDRPRLRPTPKPGEGDDSDVMEREIATIPDVIRDRLALAGQAESTVQRLREAGVRHLVLVGCGDSSFACEAAALALNRHSGIRAQSEHALDFARYGVRYHPADTAVIVVSFSGKTGRTIEAAHQARAFGHLVIALTGRSDSPVADGADCILSAEIPTFGFSPGTSTYTAMLVTLLTLAAELGAAADEVPPALGEYVEALQRLPELAEETLRLSDVAARDVAARVVGARMTTFLGAGPNEASAKFGAAKLFEGAQQVALSTNVEEWAHEQYFITRPGEPVILVAPRGASSDRAGEILSELEYVGALPVFVSDHAPSGPALHLPIAPGAGEELTPVLASIPLSQIGLHAMRLGGKRSYNFPDEAASREHYDTIHRATIGEPA